MMRHPLRAVPLLVIVTACATGASPARAPEEAETEAPDSTSEAFASDGSDEASDGEGDEHVALVSCAGKDATFWDNGAMKSQVLTSACTIEGTTYPAGTLIEFDKNGVFRPGQ